MIRQSLWLVGWCALLAAAHPALAAPADDDARALAAKIDNYLAQRWADAGVEPTLPATDAEFLRRVSLEVAGRIPSVAEARAFLNDPSSDKRHRLVKELLDSPAYVNHFGNVWRDLLMPETNLDFQVQASVPAFTAWLRRHFADNSGYDKVVRELLTTSLGIERGQYFDPYRQGMTMSPTAFYLAKEAKAENLAASTARLFLGVKLECAQCHNHPFASWTRQQFWEYAAFFAGFQPQGDGNQLYGLREHTDRREMAIPGTSQVVQAAFLDGSEPQWRYKVNPRVTLADWLTRADNPYFARATVNRVWGQFFGTGIVDPVDDFNQENRPSHPELLDELARDFAAHNFDLKYLVLALTSTRAYQLSSVQTQPGQDDPRLFARMPVKGMTTEQLFDSIALATGFREPRMVNNPFNVDTNSPRAMFKQKFGGQEKATEFQTSILQALQLMNGKFVADMTSLDRSATMAAVAQAPFLDTAGKVETLFLATLSRKPRPDEAKRFIEYVESGGARKAPKLALTDVFWALLNSSEFIMNH